MREPNGERRTGLERAIKSWTASHAFVLSASHSCARIWILLSTEPKHTPSSEPTNCSLTRWPVYHLGIVIVAALLNLERQPKAQLNHGPTDELTLVSELARLLARSKNVGCLRLGRRRVRDLVCWLVSKSLCARTFCPVFAHLSSTKTRTPTQAAASAQHNYWCKVYLKQN